MIEFTQVSKMFNGQSAVSDLNLHFKTGAFSVLIGTSGSGKSTTLKMINRLVEHDAGTIRFAGEEIRSLPLLALRRRMGYAIQSIGLFPHWTVAQNIATVPQLLKWPRAKIDARIDELMALLGLDPQLRGRYPHQPLFTRWRQEDDRAVQRAMQATGVADLALQSVDTLSGGQRQRAWIAMVLAQETAIMLLDEPTTWLDISYQIDVLELLSELNREKGYTLAAVLHDLNQACRYATHLIALRDGKMVAQGAPKEIVTAELIEAVYGLRCMIIEDPVAHTPLVVPLGRTGI